MARFAALYVAAGPALRDAYVLANNTPNIIYELILGGILTATLVPLFTAQLEHDDEEGTSAVVSVAVVGLGVLTVLALIAAPLLILLYGTNPGKGVDAGDFRRVGIVLALLFAPQVFFYGLMALGTALLNARRHFIAAAWAPVLNNVVVIAILLLVGAFDIGGDEPLSKVRHHGGLLLLLGLGTTAGIVAMAVALLPPMRRAGVRIRFHPDWHHPGVRKALALSGWTVGYVIANQVAAQTVAVLAEAGFGQRDQLQRRLHVLPAPPRAAGGVADDDVPARPRGAAVHRDSVRVQRAAAPRSAAAGARRGAGRDRVPGADPQRRRCRTGERRAGHRRGAPGRPHPRRVRARAHRLLDVPLRAPRVLRARRTPAPRSSSTASRT